MSERISLWRRFRHWYRNVIHRRRIKAALKKMIKEREAKNK
jgi:hypothetical protein